MARADRYYDVGCDFCGKHLSTDYQTGLFDTRRQAETKAKQIGFKPECLRANRKG